MHGDYYNALAQIEHLELINKEICNERDDKVIRNFEDLQGKYRRKKIALRNYNSWKFMQTGNGVKKKKN